MTLAGPTPSIFGFHFSVPDGVLLHQLPHSPARSPRQSLSLPGVHCAYAQADTPHEFTQRHTQTHRHTYTHARRDTIINFGDLLEDAILNAATRAAARARLVISLGRCECLPSNCNMTVCVCVYVRVCTCVRGYVLFAIAITLHGTAIHDRPGI